MLVLQTWLDLALVIGNVFRPSAKWKDKQQMKIIKSAKAPVGVAIWLMYLIKQRMPQSYYRNALAKCYFEENLSKLQRYNHERHIHDKKYETKIGELLF